MYNIVWNILACDDKLLYISSVFSVNCTFLVYSLLIHNNTGRSIQLLSVDRSPKDNSTWSCWHANFLTCLCQRLFVQCFLNKRNLIEIGRGTSWKYHVLANILTMLVNYWYELELFSFKNVMDGIMFKYISIEYEKCIQKKWSCTNLYK